MKKFIMKSILLVLIIWLPWWSFVEYGKNYYAPIDYQTWEFKHDFLSKAVKEDPKELIIGDSLAVAAINPNLVSERLYNLAMSGMTPVDAWYYLKKYFKTGRSPERIFLSFGTTHWQGSDTFKEHSLGFGYMKFSEFFDFINTTENLSLFYRPEQTFDVFKDWFPFNYFWKSIVKNHHKNLASIEFFLLKLGLTPLQFNHIKSVFFEMIDDQSISNKKEIKEMMYKTRGHHFFDFNDTTNLVNPITKFDGWKIHPLNDIYLRKIIELCNEKNIKVVIDFVPNNHTSWTQYRPEFFQEMNKYFENLKSTYTDLTVSDLKSLPKELYGDMDHVNEAVSVEYSAIFKKKYFQK